MKKIFTFLVAFLTTLSGAVWGQTGSGTEGDPWIINLNSPQAISDNGGLLGAKRDIVTLESGNAIEIHLDGYYKVTGTTSIYHINIGHMGAAGVVGYGPSGEDEIVYITLDNVTINSPSPIWFYDNGNNSGELYVDITLVGENRLTSTNNSSAIFVNANSNLNINAGSTGSLYAIGSVGIGNDEEPDDAIIPDEQQGAVGNIAIYGGTVVAMGNGQYPGIGGRAYDETDVTINGNTFVVTNNGDGNAIQKFEKGIFYDTSEGDNTASVYGAVVLNSEYPSSEGILENELKFDITEGATLTLGSGISFPTTRLANTNDEDKLKAYKVIYDLNKSVGENEDIQITNEADYVAIYAGANVDLATLPEDSRTDVPSWQAMAWGQNNSGTYAKVTKTGSTTPTTSVANNQINATTIWAVDTWTDINVTQNKTIRGAIQLFYPQEAASLFTISNGSDLNQYGAALGSGDSQNKVVAHTTGATASVSETAANVNLTIANESKTITLPFIVNANTPDLSDATLTKLTTKNVEYDSNAVEQDDILAAFTYKGGNIAWSDELFDLQFKADNADQAGTDLTSAPEDAGKYWVSIKAKDSNENYQGETEYVQFKITAKTVTVKSVADEVYTINGDDTFDWSDNVTMKGLIDGDDVTIKYNGTPEGFDYLDTPGTYNVSYTIKKEGTDANNYTIPESTTGKLIVKKTGNSDNPINPGDPDGEDTEIIPGTDTDQDGWEWVAGNNRYERTYDGESHLLSTISLKYKNEDGETAWETLSSDKFSVEYSSTPVKDVVEAGYTATITITGSEYYSGTATMTLYINPRPMVIDINKLTAEDVAGIIAATEITISEADVDFEKFDAEKESGIVAEEESDAKVSGKIIVAPAESTEEDKKAYEITVEKDDFTLSGVEGGKFTATNYKATYTYTGKSIEDGTITEIIDDITPGEDTDIDDGNGDEDNNWKWDVDEQAYVVIYDGKEHGITSITVSGEEATDIQVTYSNKEGELGEGVLPLNAGHYTAEVIVTVDGTSKTGTIPLLIKQRPLGVHFNLDDYILEAGGVYDAVDVAEYEPVEVEENVWVGGELKSEEPVLEGKIKVADTPNSEDKYAVTFEGVKLGTDEDFDAENYEPTYYLNGELIELDENGNGTFGGDDDPEQGIDISEPDDETGISGIGTKRYRLYLANKDYNVVDAKADYAAEGLELFSRHDKKYTKAGGSFTVWYEKDGVANAGGYRIFWSNRANGEYKEVKFDTVSEYFQIRNVQSDVYVKIYAADGFPVGNEEISAADYRAYAQPNKIVVITPQPTDVQIISMAGAVVATDKVTGQREFANLTEGVYIVRMGETVVKLQVRK